MKGAGFCLLYQGFYYIKVYYIKSRVYTNTDSYTSTIDKPLFCALCTLINPSNPISLDYSNCMQYFEYGIKKNGNYYIQKNNSIIQVYCQFDGMGYENCQDYFNNAYNESGYYWLYVNDISFKVYCDFSTGNAS